MYWSWLYSSYANWFGCLIGAIFGAGNTTPVASGEYVGTPLVENVGAALLMSVAAASLLAVGLSILGLSVQGKGDFRH